MEVYFDDLTLRHIKSPVLQHNEYYPFGLQTANSWTRENVTANNYLANGGTELNQTSQLYDLYYRNYDPALGRMFQIDPMASKYGSLTPYNYSLNNPANLNDPLGDDVEPQPPYPREYQCAMCWREGDSKALYMMVSGGGGFSGQWSYRQSGINSANSYWHNGVMDWKRGLKEDAEAVKNGGMSYADYGAKYGATIYEKGGGIEWTSEIFNPWMGAEISRTADNTITYAGGWMKIDLGIMAKLMFKGYQINVRNVGRVNRFYADGGQTQGNGPGLTDLLLAGIGTAGLVAESQSSTIAGSRSGYTSGKLSMDSPRSYSKATASRIYWTAKGAGFGLTAWSLYDNRDQFRNGKISQSRYRYNNLNIGVGTLVPQFGIPIAAGDYLGQKYSNEIVNDISQPGGYAFEATKWILEILGIPTSPGRK